MVIELTQSVYFSLILISGLFCSVFQIKMSHRHIWYVKFSFIFGPKKKILSFVARQMPQKSAQVIEQKKKSAQAPRYV